MKYLFTLSILFLTSHVFCQFLSFTSGVQKTSTEKTLPERSTKNGNTHFYEVTYKFMGAVINDRNHLDKTYNLLYIDGFAPMGKVGAPALPAHNEIIAMPRNSVGNIVILESDYYEYPGFMVYPALKPALDTEGAEEPVFEKDMKIYNSNSFFPEEIVEISNVGISRGTPLAKVQVRPIQFNPVTGIIRVYTKIHYRLEYQGGFDSFNYIAQENSLHYTNLLKLNVINSESIPDGIPTHQSAEASGSRSGEKNYIIITHSEYLSQANDLANWKRQLGYSVEIVSQSSWTSTQVKTEIQNRFSSWTPKPDYFVIIGDHTGAYAVPGEIHQDPGYGEDFATDLYFACMDGGSDWHPDIAHGRISVSSSSEASIVIDKTINYEKTPPSSSLFYSNILNCAQYQDDDNDGYADRRFCNTSEDIREYLQDEYSYTAERVYYTSSTADVTTLRYNAGYFSISDLLPAELRNTSFNWSGGSSQITSAINAGKFMVFHRDHGYVGGSGWAHPYYTTSSMNSLTNGDLLPVIFSMNCHTGEFQLSNCFAEKFLRMENKGAVGVVAAAYYSYSGYNDALSGGMIDAIWADPGLYPVFGTGGTGTNYTIGLGNDIYTMGDVVNQGLYAMEQNWNGGSNSNNYQYELFHWFGDPAMKIWTTNPNLSIIAATHSSTIDCNNSSFSITGSEPNATATLVYNNELIGETILDGSGNGNIQYAITTPGTNVTITVSKHNHYSYESNITVTGICAFPPAVETSTTTSVGQTSAIANGNITSDFGSAIIESGIVYSQNPNPVIGDVGVTNIETSPTVILGAFTVNIPGLTSSVTYYVRAYAINANGISYGYDDLFTTLAGPVTLPWTEDWESITISTYTANAAAIVGAQEWDFNTSLSGGRLRFEAGSSYYHDGTKAATLDRDPSGDYTINYLTANLNMAAYSSSTDVELSFYFMHHGEELHTNDRVWVRGSSADSWLELYNLYTYQGLSGTWNQVVNLDVDASLASAIPPQTISGTFQIRFGQEDNYPSTSITSADGYTFDDIILTGTTVVPVNNTVQNTTVLSGETECCDAINTLTIAGSGTTVNIMATGSATFIAGQKISIEPGFTANEGSSVNAYITTTGEYCNSIPTMVPGGEIEIEESSNTEVTTVDIDSEIKIYPNPTSGFFTIDFKGLATTAEIKVINFQGKTVHKTKCNNQSQIVMDIRKLKTGVYIVVIKMEEKVIIKKVIRSV